jgi:hypothetical protein
MRRRTRMAALLLGAAVVAGGATAVAPAAYATPNQCVNVPTGVFLVD